MANNKNQFLLLGGETKALVGHIRVSFVQRKVFSYMQKGFVSLACSCFIAVVDWLSLIVCFRCCCSCHLLFLVSFNLLFLFLFLFLFNLLFLFLLLVLLTYHLLFFCGGLFWFCVRLLWFLFCFRCPKTIFLAVSEVFSPFSLPKPLYSKLFFFILFRLCLWSFFFLLCFPSSSSDFSYVSSSSSSSSSVLQLLSPFHLLSSLFPLFSAKSFSNNFTLFGLGQSFFFCLLFFDVSSVLFWLC